MFYEGLYGIIEALNVGVWCAHFFLSFSYFLFFLFEMIYY